MSRPLAVFAALLLGAAPGCDAKKKSTAPDTPGEAGAPGGATPGRRPTLQELARSGKIPVTEVPGPSVGGVPNKLSGGGGVEVTPCRFDAVDAAIAAAKGKVVLIDCWATWCPPCVASFPKLVEKHQKYAARGLAVMSVSLDEPDEGPAVIEFLKKNNATFTNLHLTMDQAADQALKSKLAYRGSIPHAVLFDKGGKRVWAGHPMTADLEKKIEAELAR